MACFAIVLVLWIFSVCLHEYGHAKVAYHGGDTTVEEKGYLSMNPIRYAHPVMSFALPILFLLMGGIALPGGAVYIDRNLLRSKGWCTAVSLAGPAMNLILVLVLTMVLRLFFLPYYPYHVATYALVFVLQLQISAILFNLIPLPPLDGFNALQPWLAPELQDTFSTVGNFGIFALYFIFRIPAANHFFWGLVYNICYFLGVNPDLGYLGYQAFRFWDN